MKVNDIIRLPLPADTDIREYEAGDWLLIRDNATSLADVLAVSGNSDFWDIPGCEPEPAGVPCFIAVMVETPDRNQGAALRVMETEVTS